MATATQVQDVKSNDQLLRYALRGNGIFSVSSGILLLLAASPIANFLGIQGAEILDILSGTTFIAVIGLLLIPYGLALFYASEQPAINRTIGWVAVESDMAWVIGSGILLITEVLPLTRAGAWSVLIATDVVLVFAIVQYIGLRRMRAS